MDFALFDKLPSGITAVLIVCFFLYVMWDKIRGASSKLYRDSAQDYKTRISQLTEEIEDLRTAINENDRASQARATESLSQIANLRGVIQEKDKHIESLTRLIQGRNPEIIELLTELKNSNSDVKNFMKLAMDTMQSMTKELNHQTVILEETKRRNETIDQAHKSAL